MHPDGNCVPRTCEPGQAAPHQQRIFSSYWKRVHHLPNRQVAHTRYARDIEWYEVVALKMELKQDTIERLRLWFSVCSLVKHHLQCFQCFRHHPGSFALSHQVFQRVVIGANSLHAGGDEAMLGSAIRETRESTRRSEIFIGDLLA
jgi:hypothetical protein